MASRTFIRLAGILLVAACVWLTAGYAREKNVSPDQTRRIAYLVQYGSAKDLAAALGRHFKGDAEVEALPQPNSNCLLIRANASVFDDVLKTLQVLDRRPRLVVVEAWIADVLPAKSEKGADAKPAAIDEKALTGPAGEVQDRLRALQRKGQLGSLKRLQSTVAENQTGTVLEGVMQPVVMGIMTTGAGHVARSITYRNTGTQVRCTPRVADDKTVMLELKVEDSRLHQPADGVVIGDNEKKEPIRAPVMILATYNGTVSVAPGQAVLLRDVKMDAKATGPNRTLVIVTAHLADGEAKPEKRADSAER